MNRPSGEAAVATDAWRVCVEPDGCTGAENMALDQALLDEAAAQGTATLRLYRFNPSCLSLGRNQKDLHPDGVDVVRRPTGGGAVWHEHEVTYAVAAPIEPFGSLRAAYHAIHALIATALRTLGVEATLAPHRRLIPPSPHPTVACFSTPIGGEILANGRKLVGSAQLRQGPAFLQHGSILLDGTQEMVARVGCGTWDGYETTLRTVLGRVAGFEEVATAVVDAFADRLTAASSDRRFIRPPPILARP
ncbi:MAG TPA: lipoate--protein ligase family protein [Gemmatimonadales bacterium]|nr:lipoate--protein ligase family protein [Gemmatimonadales bacterium]